MKRTALVIGFGVASTVIAAPPALIWQHPVGTGAIDETSLCVENTDTGGFIVCGRRLNAAGNYDIVLMRLRADGAVIWHRQFDAAGVDDQALSVVQTFDGGFAVAGESRSPGAPLGTFILKVNGAGATMWGRIYWGAPFAAGVPTARVVEIPGGDLIVVSRVQIPGAASHSASAFRVTAAGGPMWAAGYQDGRYGPGGQMSLQDVILDPTGAPTVWAVGHTRGTAAGAPREALFMQIDIATGAPILAGVYNPVGVYDASANSITPMFTPGGVPMGFGVAGLYTAFPGAPAGSFLVRTSLAAMPITPLIGHPDFFVANSALEHHMPAPTWIGEFSMAGRWGPPGAVPDAALVRADAGAMGMYLIRYGGPRSDEFCSLIRTPDCALAMVGRTDSFPAAPPSDHYHVKANSDGVSGCNEIREPQLSLPLPTSPRTIPIIRVGIQLNAFNPVNAPVLSAEFSKCLTCPADLNMDGIVDFNDYLEFLNRYNANDISVDFNCDAIVDFNDYLEFLNRYNSGC